ncbi:MAG: helix-turn-helix domain-containing protein, partial [Pseudomonadales bacterium]
GRQTNITYYGVRIDAYLASRLISFLPDVLHLRTLADSNPWLHSTIGFIAQEASEQSPGSETVITRLADVLVIQAIRAWLDTAQHEEHGWIVALHDRKIGAAMSLMHRHPAYQWTVEVLAREIGMSRSGFSARFTALVGEPALTYLTELRMQMANRELCNTTDSQAVIAERVGYQSEPAFNRAFKRVVGISPGKVRK